jgi:uncharacterized repeat protein (TIGR02543 family)
MRNKSAWLALSLFILGTMLCFSVAQTAAIGATGEVNVTLEQSMTIDDIQIAIQNAIDDPANYDIIIIGGSKTDANGLLAFDIPFGKTVKWGASYSGVLPSSEYGFITLTGGGVFEAIEGCSIAPNGSGRAIQPRDNVSIIVSDGLITVGEACAAIEAYDGDITINGGTVLGTNSSVIYSAGDRSTVTVNDGTVSTSGGNAISTQGKHSKVYINGGCVEAVGWGGTAISVHGDYISISGDCVVRTTGDDATTVYSQNSTIEVSGGTVLAEGRGGRAISCNSGSISVSGGTVLASGIAYHDNNNGLTKIPSAIASESGNITIFSGALVEATGYGGVAIRTYNGHIEIAGGKVSASATGIGSFPGDYSAGSTIYVANNVGSVSISGGVVMNDMKGLFSHAINSSGDVRISDGLVFYIASDYSNTYPALIEYAIKTPNFIEPTGSGIVIAINQHVAATYTDGTFVDIAVSPLRSSGVDAYWSNNGSDAGISYANGSNQGFIPITGVSVRPTSNRFVVNHQSDWDTLANNAGVLMSGDTIILHADVAGNIQIPGSATGLTILGNGNSINGLVQLCNLSEKASFDLVIDNVVIKGSPGICFDTTGSNTLTVRGICILEEGAGIDYKGSFTINIDDNASLYSGASIISSGNVSVPTVINVGNGLLTVIGDADHSGIRGSSDLTIKIDSGAMYVSGGGDVYGTGAISGSYRLNIEINTGSLSVFGINGASGIYGYETTIYCNGSLFVFGGEDPVFSYQGHGIDAASMFAFSGSPAELIIQPGINIGTGNSGFSIKCAGTFVNNSTNMAMTNNSSVPIVYLDEARLCVIDYDANGGAGTMQSSMVVKGRSYAISTNAFTRPDYNFSGWNTASDGNGTAYAASATIANVQGDITLFAQWSRINTGGSTGGSTYPSIGGGAGGTATLSTAGTSTAPISYTLAGGIVNLSMPESKVAEIISKSTEGTIVIDLSNISTATAVTLPCAALSQLADNNLDIVLKLPHGTLSFDPRSAASVASQASGANANITISTNKVDRAALSIAQQAVVKPDNLIINIGIATSDKAITSFSGDLKVTVAYTGKTPVSVWFLNAANELEPMYCEYNSINGTVSFTTDHLSLYVIGYNDDGIMRIRLTIGALSYTVNSILYKMDVEPTIINDRTMVPLRFIAEALGADVVWNGENQTVTVKLEDSVISVTIGETSIGMDMPAMIVNGRTMVPLRYIGESLGCEVQWNPDAKTIDITR